MSIWTRIIKAIEALAKGESLSDVFDKLKAPPERSIAFTIAVIALGAKMAKADGYVTPGEVKAFRQVFRIPTGEESNAARVFNLARQDVAGYELYAKRISSMFGQGHQTLIDLLEGLFTLLPPIVIIIQMKINFYQQLVLFLASRMLSSKLFEPDVCRIWNRILTQS